MGGRECRVGAVKRQRLLEKTTKKFLQIGRCARLRDLDKSPANGGIDGNRASSQPTSILRADFVRLAKPLPLQLLSHESLVSIDIHSENLIVNQLGGLWRDTWWVWVGFVAITVILGVTVGMFFYLLIPCLPVPFAYFAFNRYDEDGNEKADL